MIIIGHGVDILEVQKMANAIRRNQKIILKILHAEEQKDLQNIQNLDKIVAFVAKRFAAKEALAKAIGSGIFNAHFQMNQIQIKHNIRGVPYFNVNQHLLDAIRTFCHTACFKVHLSISDTQSFAQASVIIEAINEAQESLF